MRESSIIKLIIGGTLTLLTAWSLYWFFTNYEQATREVTTGYSQEARNNPFLAAERFLTRLGVKASSISVAELWTSGLKSDDVVMFFHFTLPHSKSRQTQLREWVESGGHLIIDADSLPNTDDDDEKTIEHNFLSELGVKVSYPDPDENTEYEQRVSIKFDGVKQPVNVTMPKYLQLVDSANKATAGAKLGKGYGLLQYAVGNGYVTVLADNSFLLNGRIGDQDNALALALLVGVKDVGKVWLVRDVIMPSLPELAWKYAPQAVIASLIALLIWLWSLGKRLGPPLPPAQPLRRDIGEHLTATAHYLWQLDHGEALLEANRQRIEQAWLNKHYTLRSMPQQERCEWIAARSGLTAAVVERALYTGQGTESDFIELSSYLQILRTAL